MTASEMPPLTLGKEAAQRMAEWARNDPRTFADLMHLVLKGDARTAQLASTPMALAIEAAPELATPWLSRILVLLDSQTHPTVYRNVMRSLQFAPLPQHLQARIFDKAIAWITDPTKDLAPRAFAITTAHRIARLHPELTAEFKLVLQDVLCTCPGPAVACRAKKAMQDQDRTA